MDGATFIRTLRESVGENSASQYLDARTSYQWGQEAACEEVRRGRLLRATQTITTQAETASYVLNADFLSLDLRNKNGDPIIKYNDGTTDHWLDFEEYDDLVYGNQTDSVSVPSKFAIIDKAALYSQITGTATSAGAQSAGLSILTDTSGLFTTTDYVSAGDIIHNTTDTSSGVVLSVTDATHLNTALFSNSSGAVASWEASDAYVIQPQGRLQIVLDPPPSTAGHTITVYYLQRPSPVYHDYGTWRFPSQYCDALVEYVAAKYKLADKDINDWNAFKKEWYGRLGEIAASANKTFNRGGITMSMRGKK